MQVSEAVQILWDFHCVYDELANSDVIIGLGSYDIRVATHCARLFHVGLADRIIFTGSSGNWTSDLFPEGEAQAFMEQAKVEGVPEGAIQLEPRATNIGENVRFSADMAPNAKRAIFVTKPQTQLRCKATVQKQWTRVQAVVTAPATPFQAQPLPHHNERALICEMVGDFARMEDYAHKGFQIEVGIPDGTYAAFRTLVAAGYVEHLPKQTSSS